MKYFIFIPLMLILFLASCTQSKRAGGLYEPKFYTKMRAEKNNMPIVKQGIAGQSYHSALGSLCTKYTDNHNQILICNNGKTEKQVRILQ